MVEQNFLASLVASPVKEDYQIITFCEEPRAAYDRVHLSEFFSGKTADDLAGNVASFTGADMSTKLKLMGVDVDNLSPINFITVIYYIFSAEPASVRDCRNLEARDGKL